MRQLTLPLDGIKTYQPEINYYDNLATILSGDLNYQENGNSNNTHQSHKAHSFPAKFPPQLPRQFIIELTNKDDIVLDPMMGSGTTLLEAYLLERRVIGFDIDPLAVLLSQVKVQPFDIPNLKKTGSRIIEEANKALTLYSNTLLHEKEKRFDLETSRFIDYWFALETQLELLALLLEIEKVEDKKVKEFFLLTFSAIIITKTGGVSLALDLAHTRPHKAKVVISKAGKFIVGNEDSEKPKHSILTKTLRSPLIEFEKKFFQIIRGVLEIHPYNFPPIISYGNSQSLPLAASSIDLIVTSPPYAANAIDYMRAHKFTLVWFGYPIDVLAHKRNTYIGGEGFIKLPFIELPNRVIKVIEPVSQKSRSKGKALSRYYSEMTLVLGEMYRVLKSGKAAIVVVGNSTLTGEDAKIHDCLVEIGRAIGFKVPGVGIRQLDRNKRMLPAGTDINKSSQIQQRMHEEYVIGFYKP
ncbi:site-specific DNA-methyltransferase [Candidatus Dojkabacteria bacterium]|nr:site-specific DNA-methyltransferase [Candidatus Dojkabacteria bacterium]